MNNLFLITSVINTPNNRLSYSKIRSVFNREERFKQTKKTIKSIKEKMPNSKILIVECTNFNNIEKIYFHNECDYILNLWDYKELHKSIFGVSKSLGEGTMTIEALKYINKNNLNFNNIIKISGRYWLNNNFNTKLFISDKMIFKKINDNINNIFTALYKISYKNVLVLLNFLLENVHKMKKCVGYEVIFGFFVNKIEKEDIIFLNPIGLEGHVTVCGKKYIG